MQFHLRFAAAWLLSLVSAGHLRRNSTAQAVLSTNASQVKNVYVQGPPTFQDYYNKIQAGRGVWKWNVALDAYQRHFGPFAGQGAKMLEIGVQSGGSIGMYHSVLPRVYYYGMDINKNCEWFKDEQTTIYIGDQSNVAAWNHFFTAVTPVLDMAIDDGGHQAFQMTTTIQQVLPRMSQGGFFLTEDIHGINQDYFSGFFSHAADAIASFVSLNGAVVQSVHVYPFVLGVQLGPTSGGQWQPPAPTHVVSSFNELMSALELPGNLGGVVKVANPAWASLLTSDSLKNFFHQFYDLHGGVVREEPAHCHDGMGAICAMIATNTHLQNLVKGVHVFSTYAVVEVHAQPPVISAHRKGTDWIPYNGP